MQIIIASHSITLDRRRREDSHDIRQSMKLAKTENLKSMSSVASNQPHSPIERILIFHPTLPEKCMGGPLSENAGIDEISEQIFFYHHNNRLVEDPSTTMVEAVQFLSLCNALYTLPSSLGTNAADRTKEIFFGKSTLVFVPLESPEDILAIIQLPRKNGGGNPLAVRKSVERCHSLFCMFRGGGIVHQLRQQGTAKRSGSSPFPGMAKLYSLRNELRKTKERLARCRSDDKDCALHDVEIEKLGLEIDNMLLWLPTQRIRRDLDIHYKEYLGDTSLVMSRQGGGMRCLVDCIPIPIPQISGHHTFQSAPSTLHPKVGIDLGLEIRHFLQQDRSQQLFLGIATFHSGHLMFTHASDCRLVLYDTFQKQSSDIIANETISLIMAYLASYRTKMTQLSKAKTVSTGESTSQPSMGIKNLELAFSSMKDCSPQSCDSNTNLNGPTTDQHLGSFLHPPPSFMLSELDDCQSYLISNGQKVWAPKLHLPLFGQAESLNETCLATGVVLYDVHDFSFLLFFDTGISRSDQGWNNKNAAEAMTWAQDRLSAAVTNATLAFSLGKEKMEKDVATWAGFGVDLILVDREQHELILFSDRDQSDVQAKRSIVPKENHPFQFLGFGSGKRRHNVIYHKNLASLRSEWSALGLDCRHLLASHLHLDVLLAFDDIMNEAASIRNHALGSGCGKAFSQLKVDRSLELCTCMTLGWVYAFVSDELEMYAFFDNSTYVTVADVQNAVNGIKEIQFQNWKNNGRKLP